jgi:transposase
MMDVIVYIGVDVSKDWLDVHTPGLKPLRVHNSASGARQLLGRLAKLGAPFQVCVEATGGYEELLVSACWRYQVPVSRLNPWHIRRYAQSQGQLAKTDRLDAAVIAAFALHKRPAPNPPPPAWRVELDALWTRRSQMVEDRVRELSRLEHEQNPFCRRTIRQHIAWYDRQIAKLEACAREVIAANPEAATLVSRFRLVKSVGLTTAVAVLVGAPEIGALGPKRAATLAGLAPMADDSGRHTGVRRIQRGRFALRRALYMSALVAAKHNPILAVFYRRLISAGKCHKQALVAVMRKLIVLLDRIAGDPQFIPATAHT